MAEQRYGGTGTDYGPARPTQAQMANQILQVLQQAQVMYGLPVEWLQSSLGIAQQESNFEWSAANEGNPQRERSYGPWQINLNAHPNVSVEQARDPIFSTQHRIPSLVRAWNQLGGLQAFQRNPTAFQQQFHATAQGSVVPTAEQANNSLAVGYSILNGAPTNFSPTYKGPTPTNYVSGIDLGLPKPTPPPTTADGLQSLLIQRLGMAVASSDPVEQAAIPSISSALDAVRRLNNDPSPDVLAQIGAQVGISAAQIASRREELLLTQAFNAAENDQQRAFQMAIQTGNWDLARQQLAFDRDKWTQSYHLDLERHGLNAAEVYGNLDLARQRLGLERNRFDLESALGIGNLNISQQRLGLDRELGLGQLGLAQQRLGLDRDELLSNRDYRSQMLQLERDKGLREDRRANMSALIDVFGSLVSAGRMDVDIANNQLRALVDTWEQRKTPYAPGMEPNGAYAQLIAGSGGTYNPEDHRIRPFPLDLATMYKAQSQGFNMSDSWKKAQELVSGIWQQPNTNTINNPPNTPVSTPTPADITALQTAAQPVMNQPSPSTPPVQPPVQSPAQPPTQPTNTYVECPPGFRKVWDGNTYQCQPIAPPTQPQPTGG